MRGALTARSATMMRRSAVQFLHLCIIIKLSSSYNVMTMSCTSTSSYNHIARYSITHLDSWKDYEKPWLPPAHHCPPDMSWSRHVLVSDIRLDVGLVRHVWFLIGGIPRIRRNLINPFSFLFFGVSYNGTAVRRYNLFKTYLWVVTSIVLSIVLSINECQ
jgi:hypothetical protein